MDRRCGNGDRSRKGLCTRLVLCRAHYALSYFLVFLSVSTSVFTLFSADARGAHLVCWGEVLRPALRLGRIPTPSTVSLTLYLHHSLALFSRSYYVHDLSFLSFFFVPQVFILCTIFMIYLFLSLLCSPGDHTMYYLHDLSFPLSPLFSRCSYYVLSS